MVFVKQTLKLKLKKLNSTDIKIEGVSDKLIILEFFTTWCPPCKAQIPHLINLQKRYKDKLQIISILLESDKSSEEIKSFINYYGINYTVSTANNNHLLSQEFSIPSIPTMIMYDKNGKYFTHYIGAVPEEMIEADINRVVKK